MQRTDVPRSGEEIVDKCRVLHDMIRADAVEIEQLGRMTDRVVDGLRDAGVFGMATPLAMGGPEADPLTQLEVSEVLSTSDASVGWIATIASDTGYHAARLPEATAKEIAQAGGTAKASRYDATSAEEAKTLVAQTVEAFGGLDVLCNIAGIGGMVNTLEETVERWDMMMAVNINGPFYLTQAAIPHLLEREGNIVNMASVAGMIGQSYTAAYCASKHALVGLTKSLALEFGRRGLRVNAICPGATNTNILNSFALPEGIDGSLIARYSYRDDIAEPEDIAKLIAFVASADGHYMNGASVSIDGGITAG